MKRRRNPAPRNWNKVSVTYFASTGPDASHFGHTVTIHNKLSTAKAAVASRPNGWVYAILRGEDTPYEARGVKVVAASDVQTREYACQYAEKVSRR